MGLRAAPRSMATVAIAPDVQTHPTATAVTLALKMAPIATYLACEIVNSDGFVANFVACVLALAVDFWWCKNVSGRLLVGLRYWNEIDDAVRRRHRVGRAARRRHRVVRIELRVDPVGGA